MISLLSAGKKQVSVFSLLSVLLGFGLTVPSALRAASPVLPDASVADLQVAMEKGTISSEALTKAYLERIAAYDQKGPKINTVITLNTRALDEARALDAERAQGKVRGPLHGIPIVLKDNFDTYDMPTTAGSQLLAGAMAPDDAFVVKKLRAAGTLILAKVNLSEFASGGGSVSGAKDPAVLKAGAVPNGYSSMGLQTLNPHDLSRGPAGSSGGTGAAIAAGFAQFGLGTDTAGSVRGPAAANGIVGLKTTLGLLSRDGVVPLALSFDTVGPMSRHVYDTAAALSVMTGIDPDDASTQASAGHVSADYTKYLRRGALRGARIGVARQFMGNDPEVQRITQEAIDILKKEGAIIVDNVLFPDFAVKAKQPLFVLVRNSEFKAQIADYLKTLPPGFPRNLDEIIERAHDPKVGYRSPEKAYAFKYTASQALPLEDPTYQAAIKEGVALVKAGTQAVFTRHQLDAIVYPSAVSPASLIVPSEPSGPPAESATTLVNESGFPELVVPSGMTSSGLPVGLSFFGTAFSEGKLLSYGFDFEQATKARRLPVTTPLLPSDKL